MEKAAREEGHCSKGEKPCHERGRGDKREEERRGEASSSNRRERGKDRMLRTCLPRGGTMLLA